MADGATLTTKNLHFIFGGHRVRGWMPGVFLNVAFEADAFNMTIAVDGEGAWMRNANQAARFTLTLMQTSQSNDFLSTTFLADRKSTNGILLPLVIKQSNSTNVYAAGKARVIKMADGVWGDTVQGRQWTIATTRLRAFTGGHTAPT